jgi:Protein of unknown function (DUF2800)
MHCTASAWAESQYPDSTSIFAEEGTRAHAMASDCLEQDIDAAQWGLDKFMALEDLYGELLSAIEPGSPRERELADAYEEAREKFEADYPAEMYEYVQGYIDFVHGRIDEAKQRNPDALVFIEQRVDFSPWVPEGFGTGDCVIVSDDVLDVTDLKYGKGVFVTVTENEQLMLYALGAWNMFRLLFSIKTIVLNLYQPRIGNIARYELSVAQLLEWADAHVKPVAAKVWHAMETGELDDVVFDPSDYEMCQFCRAKVHCRARRDRMLAMTIYEFREPELLTDDEVIACLDEATHLQKWAGDLQSWALTEAEHGHKFAGKKLVEGRSNRKFTDPEAVKTVLTLEGYQPMQFLKTKLLGITDMTALLKGRKKFDTLLGPFVTKPRGKPVLVDEADPRPELDDIAKASEGFEPVDELERN